MEKQMHREPTLYIVGNEERRDEIRHIIEDEWGGTNEERHNYERNDFAYFIDFAGVICWLYTTDIYLSNAVEKGWMKEFELPKKTQFKTFEKVVARSSKNSIWFADFYSRYLEYGHQLIGADTIIPYCLPFNEQTEKLIGTNDEWKGGENE